MKKFLTNLLKNKKVLSYLIIFAISVFICIPLLSKNMDISRDDGIQHICRLIGTYDTLKEGQIFPVIMSNFCNGFGYSWNIFYSPLTAYFPLIFKLITSSFVVCLKLSMFVSIFLSGVFMFQFTYKVFRSHKVGVISAILYMSAPYHLTDLYNRIAIAELASFIFIPIVFNGMYDLFYRKNTKPYGIIFGAIGLILTHNVMAVYTAIFCFIYLIIHYKKINKTILKKITICILLILLCTSFYWIPLLEHSQATTYEVFVPERMYKDNTLIGSKLSVLELFFTEKFGMIFHIGLLIIIGLILTFLYRKKIQKRYKEWLIIFTVFGICSVIMTTKIFPYEYMPDFLKMIQFTWRMMEFASFFLSGVAGYGISMFLNKNSKKEIYVVISILIYLSISILTQNKQVEIPFNEERYLDAVPVTSSTGRVHAGCASFEYLPQKAFTNREYIETRTHEVYVLEGKADIYNTNKENTNLTFEIQNVTNGTKIELPYIYYLGYNATLIKEGGSKTDLEIQESNNGFCMIQLDETQKGIIEIAYTGTALMKLSYILTYVGIICIFIYGKTLKKVT